MLVLVLLMAVFDESWNRTRCAGFVTAETKGVCMSAAGGGVGGNGGERGEGGGGEARGGGDRLGMEVR